MRHSRLDAIVARHYRRQKTISALGDFNELKNLAIGLVTAEGSLTRHYFEGKPDPHPPGKVYSIASVTKPFTGTLFQLFALEGQLDLDRPANFYMPRGARLPTFKNKPITLRHLLTQTSGLPRTPNEITNFDSESHWKFRQHFTVHDLGQALKKVRLTRAPGTKFLYSNFGFCALVAILENLEKRPFERILQEKLLAPLGMKNTGILFPRRKMIPAFTATGRQLPFEKLYYLSHTLSEGSGGIRSTAEDMVRFMALHLGLGGPASLARAAENTQAFEYLRRAHLRPEDAYADLRPVLPKTAKKFLQLQKEDYQAMPWRGSPCLGRFVHGGSVLGFRSMLWLDRKKTTGVIVLSNSELDEPEGVVPPIAEEVLNLCTYGKATLTEAQKWGRR